MIAQRPMKPEWRNRATNWQLVFVQGFKACNFGVKYSKDIMTQGKAAALIASMRPCKRGLCSIGTPQEKSKRLTGKLQRKQRETL